MDIEQTRKNNLNIIKQQHLKVSKKSRWQYFKENYELLLLTLPVLIYFFIFNYIPMFGVVIAFKNYKFNKGIFGSAWVGFENFKFFFQSQDALRITNNTVSYGAIFTITGIVFAVIVALLLFEVKNKQLIKVYQTTMILPYFLSWVIVGFTTYIFFNPVIGVFNQILGTANIKPVDWYADAKYWPSILTLTNIWKNVGLNCIMYYAALMGVNNELYEAATIDGANKLQQTWNISIPALVPLMSILSILAVGNLFRGDFGLFYQIPMDVGLLYPVTDIIDTYVYRGLRTGDMGITSAVGLFQSVVGLILVVSTNSIVKKINNENAMF